MDTFTGYGIVVVLVALIILVLSIDLWVYFRSQERTGKKVSWLFFYVGLAVGILLLLAGVAMTDPGKHKIASAEVASVED